VLNALLLQVIPPEDALERSKFYAEHNIGFVGRPPTNRRGTFKKASNLNYQLAISQLIASLMKQQPGMTAEEALEAVWEQWGREFVAQGDLTMDDDCLILLIDADTKVGPGRGGRLQAAATASTSLLQGNLHRQACDCVGCRKVHPAVAAAAAAAGA
jgi:hypothetical protein